MPAQIMQPVYAATKFYEALVKVPGWQSLPLTVAAQAVQGSANPDAYAKWESLADALVATFTGAADNCLTDNGDGAASVHGHPLPAKGLHPPARHPGRSRDRHHLRRRAARASPTSGATRDRRATTAPGWS